MYSLLLGKLKTPHSIKKQKCSHVSPTWPVQLIPKDITLNLMTSSDAENRWTLWIEETDTPVQQHAFDGSCVMATFSFLLNCCGKGEYAVVIYWSSWWFKLNETFALHPPPCVLPSIAERHWKYHPSWMLSPLDTTPPWMLPPECYHPDECDSSQVLPPTKWMLSPFDTAPLVDATPPLSVASNGCNSTPPRVSPPNGCDPPQMLRAVKRTLCPNIKFSLAVQACEKISKILAMSLHPKKA